MVVRLDKINIKASGPLSTGVKITDEFGTSITGVTSVSVKIGVGELIETTLTVRGIDGLSLKGLETILKLKDQTMIAELKRRGYEVFLDDSDIEQELSQGQNNG